METIKADVQPHITVYSPFRQAVKQVCLMMIIHQTRGPCNRSVRMNHNTIWIIANGATSKYSALTMITPTGVKSGNRNSPTSSRRGGVAALKLVALSSAGKVRVRPLIISLVKTETPAALYSSKPFFMA